MKYTDEQYKELKEKLVGALNRFDKSCEEFEKKYAEQCEEYYEDASNKVIMNAPTYYYRLDDKEAEMVDEIKEKMNCSWNYVVGQALDWYYMAVMEGVVEGDGGEKEEVEEVVEPDMVNRPKHYCSGSVETIDKIEKVVKGLPAEKAYCLGNVLKYFDRAGLKEDTEQDCDKANNYAYRLVYGEWRDEVEDKRNNPCYPMCDGWGLY